MTSNKRREGEVERPKGPPPRRLSSLKALLVGLGFVATLTFAIRAVMQPPEPPVGPPTQSSADPSHVPRCVAVAPGRSYVVGGSSDVAPAPSANAPDVDLAAGRDRDDMLAPFAIIMGRATALPDDKGFAVGVQGDGDGGSIASVVFVHPDGGGGSATKLSRSRGDLDPPVVAALPDGAVMAALLEPNASGRSVRLALVRGDQVSWGADLPEGKDESLALDLVLGERRGIVSWDGADKSHGYIALSTFERADPASATVPKRITAKDVDADAPRVAVRPGGFFVVYVVRGREVARHLAKPDVDDSENPEDKPKRGGDEADERLGGEPVLATWLEAILIDENGSPQGSPVRLSEQQGHVVGYDVHSSSDGSLMVVFRDEDSPTGASQGPVKLVRLAADGSVTAMPLPSEIDADGTPTLLAGWLVIPALRGAGQLAKRSESGELLEPPTATESFGLGEPIAATEKSLLLAEPSGKGMRLRVMRCADRSTLPVRPAAPPGVGGGDSADP